VPGRLDHVQHVLRAAALFGVGFTLFMGLRWALIPADFGRLGFYRAGAITDNQMRPLVHAGQALCLDCHGDVADVRAQGAHAPVKCEACHGPLARHASGDFEIKPPALNPRLLCLRCHTETRGKPLTFPQILPVEHFSETACSECHKPHAPGIK
jgi:hypothetical protein